MSFEFSGLRNFAKYVKHYFWPLTVNGLALEIKKFAFLRGIQSLGW